MTNLVFDVGGTKTRAGLFDPARSTLIRSVCAATPNHLDHPDLPFEGLREQLVSLLRRLGNELVGAGSVRRVDIAFAGPVDGAGAVLSAPTVWGTRQASPYALGKDVGRLWPASSVTVMNDLTAAGYRYLEAGGEDFCIATVSSGIGNKVFIGGRPMLGPDGLGGELGHLRVDESPGAPVCECGGRGHLGAVSSGRAVLEDARRHSPVKTLTSHELVAAFRRGESWAVRSIEHGAAALGWALAAMHLGVGIARFILIGGFALALGEAYRRRVAEAAAERCWKACGEWASMVELGVDDDDSGLIGAGIAGRSLGGSR
jgi:predicted NBD/HSP70 family sugar kinase